MRSDIQMSLSTSAVIRVGSARGFVVEACKEQHLVITAGHCLPDIPPRHAMSYVEERTFAKLLGPLGGEPTVWAECLFVDPLSDLAVLGPPDNLALWKEAEAYQGLVDAAAPLMVATDLDDEPPWQEGEVCELPDQRPYRRAFPNGRFVVTWRAPAWLLSLTREWVPCLVHRNANSTGGSGGRLWVESATEGSLLPGMSGSPIVVDNGVNGMAIGVFCLCRGLDGKEGGPQPRLIDNLPGWLLNEFGWHHGEGLR
jgi:hypothetical protein